MFKRFFLYIFATGLLLTSSGCFRDSPKDKLSEKSIWESPILLDDYVLPWYRNMSFGFSTYFPSTALAKSATRDFLALYTDQMTVAKNEWYNSAYGDLLAGNSTEITNRAFVIWNNYYTQIQSINKLLENAGKITPGEQKDRIMGEAHFFRAYYYYKLWQRFGGVLLIEKNYNPLYDNIRFPRASYDEMLTFILKECDLAIPYLKENMNGANQGRVELGAAYMLQAKAYMWAAGEKFQNQSVPYLGFSTNHTREYLMQAAKYYDELFKLKYSLIQLSGASREEWAKSYRQIFLTKFNQESILEVNHSDNGDFIDGYGHKLDREAAAPFYTGTTAAYTPTQNNVNEYRMANGLPITDAGSDYDKNNPYNGRDTRFYANILYNKSYFKKHYLDIETRVSGTTETKGVDLTPYGTSTTAAVTKTGYYLGKFVNEDQTIDNDPVKGSSQNFIIWRLAEAYLDYAEIAWKTGDPATALKYVNDIRRRAKVDEWTSIGTLSDINNERRVELAFEEAIYWDYYRWGQAEKQFSYTNPLRGMDIRVENGKTTYTEKSVFDRESRVRQFFSKQYYYPIPWDEIRYHKIEQNPEWIEN